MMRVKSPLLTLNLHSTLYQLQKTKLEEKTEYSNFKSNEKLFLI